MTHCASTVNQLSRIKSKSYPEPDFRMRMSYWCESVFVIQSFKQRLDELGSLLKPVCYSATVKVMSERGQVPRYPFVVNPSNYP